MMEMKMIDWSKPIETVEGNPARVLSTDHRYREQNLTLIQIEFPDFSGIGWYHQGGKPTLGSPEIRNRKTKRERWVNIYSRRVGDGHYETKDEAMENAFPDVITTIKIEWEE